MPSSRRVAPAHECITAADPSPARVRHTDDTLANCGGPARLTVLAPPGLDTTSPAALSATLHMGRSLDTHPLPLGGRTACFYAPRSPLNF